MKKESANKIFLYIFIAILVIIIGRWVWSSGYKSSEVDRMTDKEFNETYGEPRLQEMREW